MRSFTPSRRIPGRADGRLADTHYWVAVANSADQWSAAAVAAQSRLERFDIVTTDEVLVEFLGFM